MFLQRTLEELGFSRREIAFWQIVMQSGEIQLSDIAKRMGIPRTSAYTAARSLLAKGLIGFYVKRGKRFFVPASLERFTAFFDEQGAKAHALLPELQKFGRKEASRAPRIRAFEGKEGVRQVLREVLEQKRHFSAITSIEDVEAILGHYFEDFIQQRIRQGLRVRLITNRSPRGLKLAEMDAQELRQTRFVPSAFRFATANFIHNDRVAVLSLKEQPFGVIVEDRDIAATHQMYFDLLWLCIGGERM